MLRNEKSVSVRASSGDLGIELMSTSMKLDYAC